MKQNQTKRKELSKSVKGKGDKEVLKPVVENRPTKSVTEIKEITYRTRMTKTEAE